MKRRTLIKIIAVSAAGIVLIAAVGALLGIFLFSKWDQMKNADYYALGEDQVPSVKLVLGPRSLKGVSTSFRDSTQTKTYTYQSDTALSDVKEYAAYLVDEAGFVPVRLNAEDPLLYYAKESVDDGKLLLVDIYNSGFTYVVTVQKGAGTLEP